MGGNLELKSDRVVGGEPVADLVARSGKLHGTVIGGDLIPRAIDEIPLVALAATQAEGETVIHDASELRAKESDRIDCTVEILTEFGADIDGTAGRAGKSVTRVSFQKGSHHHLYNRFKYDLI